MKMTASLCPPRATYCANRNAGKAARASALGAILGSVPDAEDRHQVRARDPVDDEIRRHDHQFPRSGLASGPTAAGEHHQAVAGEQKLAPDALGRDRIVGCDVADDPTDIGQRLGTPNDGQRGSGGGTSNSPWASRRSQARASS